MSSDSGSVIIEDREVQELVFMPDVAYRQLLKSRGVPMDGNLYPKFKPGYEYETYDNLDQFSMTVKWRKLDD
jgi:hypothetical protein